MNIHETIYRTMDAPAEEVFALIGGADTSNVTVRRAKMKAFLKNNEWSLDGYAAWLKSNVNTVAPVVPNKSKGLGDTVAKLTSAIGIKPCGGCKQRQAKLNKMFPYA